METHHCKSLTDIKKVLGDNLNCGNYHYRGVGGKYPLRPSILYDERVKLEDIEDLGKCVFQQFKKYWSEAYPDCMLTDTQLIFMGRHFGMITRELDITIDFSIAFQFAFEKSYGFGAHIYCFKGLTPDPETKIHFIQSSIPGCAYAKEIIGARTQLIQGGKLLSISNDKLSRDMVDSIENTIKIIIPHDNIDDIRYDYYNEIPSTKTNLDLLINRDFQTFKDVEKINEECISTKYSV